MTPRASHTRPSDTLLPASLWPPPSLFPSQAQTHWLRIGSWGFFRHVTLRQTIVNLLGQPTFALQSCWLPAAILRAAGAAIGPRSVVFTYDYTLELTVPMPLLSIGANTLITTHVQLGVNRYSCGRWSVGTVAIGNSCLIGNNSILDVWSEGLSIPDNTWVGALSDVARCSLPETGAGAVVLGVPAHVTPVKPTTDLAESAASIPTVSLLLHLRYLYLFLYHYHYLYLYLYLFLYHYHYLYLYLFLYHYYYLYLYLFAGWSQTPLKREHHEHMVGN